MKTWHHGLFRALFSFFLVLAALSPAFPQAVAYPVHIPASLSSPESLPSPPAGGPRPTINLGSSHGYMGQGVQVTGTGVASYPGVRLAWLVEGMTRTVAVVSVGTGQAYSANLNVPDDVDPGQVQVCAAVTSAELAEFACKPFTIDAAPPGTVSGQIPLAAVASPTASNLSNQPGTSHALPASVFLQSRSGEPTYSAPIQTDGTFFIDDVSAGSYTAYVQGATPIPLDSLVIDVEPEEDVQMTIVYIQPSICEITDPTVNVSAIHATPGGIENWGMFGALGIYVRNGPSLPVTFEASLNGEIEQVERVEFHYRYDGKSKLLGSDTTPPFASAQISYDVSQLEAGEDTDLFVKPIMQGGCAEGRSRSVVLVENPMDSPLIQNGTMTWSNILNRYDFAGTVPVLSSQDWLVQNDMTVPVIDVTFENRVDGRLELEGSLYPNGNVELRLFQGHRRARLCSVDALDKRESYLGEDRSFPLGFPSETALYALNVPYQYHKSDIKTPSIEVFRFGYGIPYVAELRFSVDVGITGGVWFDGEFYPWLGKLSAWLQPVVGAELGLTVQVILLFFLRGGAKLTTEMGVGFPTSIDTFRSPAVQDAGSCFYIDIWAKIFAKVVMWKETLWQGTIVQWDSPDNCHWHQQALSTQQDDDLPRLMPAPAIASGPDGQMLAAYVEDTTPTAETPTPKVMVRFWDGGAGDWGSATALTDGAHTVSDPAAAFVGSAGKALVAWTQNTLTPETDPGDDLVALMARQEIYYAHWDGSAWTAPQRLTDDLVPDGLPSLAGDDGGATLAWQRDEDGDFSTRTDWRIAMSQWDVSGETWGEIELLGAPADTLATQTDDQRNTSFPAGGSSPTVRLEKPESTASASGPTSEVLVCPNLVYCDYDNIQEAVDAVNPGDLVKVVEGTYTGVHSREGVTQTVYISKTVTIRGGYPDPTIPGGRGIPTILDAEGQGRVLYITGQISPTIESLQITGGDASGLGGGQSGRDAGGGVYMQAPTLEAWPTISNCQVLTNTANDGGGLYASGGRPTFEGNEFAHNVAAGGGGGVYVYQAGYTFAGNRFAHNAASSGGGGIYSHQYGGSFDGNEFVSNSAGVGGGLYLSQSQISLSNNLIRGNVVTGPGGGLYFFSFTGAQQQPLALAGDLNSGLWDDKYANNVVTDNHADGQGAGIYVSALGENPFPPLHHTTIARNTGGDGSGVYVEACLGPTSQCKWTNTILVDQVVGVMQGTYPGLILDGVLWHNNGANFSSTISVTNAYTGTPAFAPDGYHLTAASVAIDRAVDSDVTIDIDGDARPQEAAPDLGADEYRPVSLAADMNAQPDVARKDGRIGLVWTVDADGDPGTSDDRRLVVADCTGSACSVEIPATLPTGADSASIVLKGSDEIYLAFLVRDGAELGNQAALWTAHYGDHGGSYNWQATPVVDDQGQPILAEAPQLDTGASGETLLAFRLFGPQETAAYQGQAALSQLSAPTQASPPLILSSTMPQWQVGVGINQSTDQATLLSVGLPPAPSAALSTHPEFAVASTTALPRWASSSLSSGSEPITSLTIDPGPDPALDPALVVSQQHATAGSSVVVTATVRNVGRQPATGLLVRLYRGDPATGQLVGTHSVAGPLGMNESVPVLFNIIAGSGQQPISARVSTSGGDASSENNTAIGDLGTLPAPGPVFVTPGPIPAHALEVRWLAPGVPGVSGYRILRSEVSGGPYQLVGEAESTVYHDYLLKLNQFYFYVVQAFDADGVRSQYSIEASGKTLAPHMVYLPVIVRAESSR